MFTQLIKRFKSTFFINLIGLSTGLAGAILIYLWVSDELNMDKFHLNDKRLFEVLINEKKGDKVVTTKGTGGPVGELLKKYIPEVEQTVTTTPAEWFQRFNLTFNDNTVSAAGNFVSQQFFSAFSYKLIQGNKEDVLNNPGGIVISQHMAQQLFHTTDNVVGKVLKWKWASFSKDCIVAGVYEDMPAGSTSHLDFVLPFDVWRQLMPITDGVTTTGPFNTFVVLKEGANKERFNQKMSSFLQSKFKDTTSVMFLQQYSATYLHNKYENGVLTGGRIEYVILFSVIAIFIVVIACINFMNLSTARASTRMKEIGVKKVFGAGRKTLIYQFLGESLLITFISLIIALLLVVVCLPQFNDISGKQLSLHFDIRLVLYLLGITLFTGIIAGSYPALYLSRFNPIVTLKGKFMVTSISELWARRGLVIFQFTVSVVFIVSVMVVYHQIKFVQNKHLGYNKDNIIYFEMQGKAMENSEAFLSALRNVNGVVNASSIEQNIIIPSFMPNSDVQWEGKNKDNAIRFVEMPVNEQLIETLGIEMQEGRSFTQHDAGTVVLNAAAVKSMGLKDPVGKTIYLNNNPGQIVGVTKNFHFNSLHEEIKPFIFKLAPKETILVMARIKDHAAIDRIGTFYKTYDPGSAFDYKFLDNDYQQQYASEKLVAVLSRYFAGLAILISCLGLFGLAAFTAERRVKEIGIRKVLGASEGSIIYLLSADFTKIVLASIVLALPVSYLITKNWLDDFAYRITLSPGYFIWAALIAIFTSWLTIGIQAIKAARVAPAICLRDI
jgi:ABC-type antimicrobial peptide transport system permease subunit